jgi:hypothetical protein
MNSSGMEAEYSISVTSWFLIFVVRQRVALTHVKQQQCIWQFHPNALNCEPEREHTPKHRDQRNNRGVD